MGQFRTVVFAVIMAWFGSAHAAEVEWRLGSAHGPQDPATLLLEDFAQRVKERSEGRFAIEVIPIETLGFKNVDSLRVLKQGVLDAMNLLSDYITRDEPLMGVFVPHGMLAEPEDNMKMVDAVYDISREIYKDNWGVVQIERGPFAALHDVAIITKQPINTLDDLRGIKFRHWTKVGVQGFNALGVSTQVIPSSELYLALKTGVVDGAAYSPAYVKPQSLHEVTCCFAYLSSITMALPYTIGVNEATWEALPTDLQTILSEESRKMWEESVETWRLNATDLAAYEWLKTEGGMKQLEPMPIADRQAIQAEMIEVWRGNCQALGDKAIAYCDRLEAAIKN